MTTKLDTAFLTIEEARSKWCPEARTVIHDPEEGTGQTVNRWDTGVAHPNAACLGDQCMFWRWHDHRPRPAPVERVEGYTLNDFGPGSRAGMVEQIYPRDASHDVWDSYATLLDAQKAVASIHNLPILEDDPGYDHAKLVELLDGTPVTWTFQAAPLPRRGYCGKAGHPDQAILIDRQMELLSFQLRDYRVAEA